MAVTDHQPWAARMRHLTTQAKDHPVEYTHSEVGFNYRLTNIQAAIGCAQMEKLDEYVAAKRSLAQHYQSELAGVPGISPMPQAQWAFSTYWLYTLLVDADVYGMDSRALLQALTRVGVQTRPLWQPLHLGKAHGGCRALGGETAENLNRKALSLPSSVGLSAESVDRVCQLIRANYTGARRACCSDSEAR
jgi:perosamine synthetase